MRQHAQRHEQMLQCISINTFFLAEPMLCLVYSHTDLIPKTCWLKLPTCLPLSTLKKHQAFTLVIKAVPGKYTVMNPGLIYAQKLSSSNQKTSKQQSWQWKRNKNWQSVFIHLHIHCGGWLVKETWVFATTMSAIIPQINAAKLT